MNVRVAHIVASINERIGGPSVSVPALSDALQEEGIQSAIWTNSYPEHGPLRSVVSPVNACEISALGKRIRGWNPGLKASLLAASSRVDLFHSHGLWMSPNRYARMVAQETLKPLIISPRGMLSEWAWNYHPIRKKIAWHCFEHKNLISAAAFHATSAAEARSVRSLGFEQPIAVIPNGIAPPEEFSIEERNSTASALGIKPQRQYCLFLSRIHPKKGILELVKAWHNIQSEFPDWHLLIAGPDQYGTMADVLRSTEINFDLSRIQVVGHADRLQREVLFSSANCFILPTFSENFGLVIGEALMRGIPVITTANSPWHCIEALNAGWICTPTISSIEHALSNAMKTDPEVRRQMGIRGQEYVQANFRWSVVAQSMSDFYNFVLHGGTPPACLYQEE